MEFRSSELDRYITGNYGEDQFKYERKGAVMATTTSVANPATAQDNSGSLSTEKVTYRGYAKYNEKGEIDTLVAKAESNNQENWKKLEAADYKQWNENDFLKYVVHSDEGFRLLVPDEEQRLYIIQSGLNYIQNSKANGLMMERQSDELTAKYSGETIDLRDSINDPPKKRALTDRQKLERLVKSMGLSPIEVAAMLSELSKNFAAQSATEVEELSA